MLGDRRKALLEPRAFVRPRVKDHAVDAELVRRPQIAGQRALRALAERGVVARQFAQVDGVKVERRVAVAGRRLREGRSPGFFHLGRPPESARSMVGLYDL